LGRGDLRNISKPSRCTSISTRLRSAGTELENFSEFKRGK
jgi:hypothetical protein